jgi:hypothetical protein
MMFSSTPLDYRARVLHHYRGNANRIGVKMRVPFLSVSPRIYKRHGKLVARTSVLACLLCLGLIFRRVTVEPKKAKVFLTRRHFWFFARTQHVPFRFIQAIIYRYGDMSGTHDLASAGKTFDVFTVGLRLSDLTEVHLFRFLGSGAFVNESCWPDWLYWENYVTDLSGAQEEESRAYVELLRRMIGVELTS